ncbi:MAG: ABC transporter permease [Myxococcales bacterium]|nr:ABC transporter permease [Myxococcales bacterium]
MFDLDRWQEIGQVLRRRKLRTGLTAFSVAWGIFMLVILLGAGNGLQHGAEYGFRDDATNSIWVYPGRTSVPHEGHAVGRPVQFTNDDHEAVAAAVSAVEHITSRFYLEGQFVVSRGERHASFDVRSCHPGHQFLENTIIKSGRFLDNLDIGERRKVAVIGTIVADALFARHEDPLGQWIDVRGIPYRVVGVFEDTGGEGELRKIYIPISTAQMAYNGQNRVHQIMFTLGDATVAESREIAAEVQRLLAHRHEFALADRQAIRVSNNLEQFQRFLDLFAWIRRFTWVIGIGTILAGIVGVSNIMLIAVQERTREIGVRKAVGATPGAIVGLIVQEALVITAVSGYVGMLAGIGALELAARVLPQSDFMRDPEVDLGVVAGATLVLVVSGLLAGYFPARRAARISPVAAMRAE